MFAVSCPQRWLLLALVGLLLIATQSSAADVFQAATTLQADFLIDLLANRARMTQVSVVAVVFGCALLWWRR